MILKWLWLSQLSAKYFIPTPYTQSQDIVIERNFVVGLTEDYMQSANWAEWEGKGSQVTEPTLLLQAKP